MDYLFYSELKEKCREIANDLDNTEKIDEVIAEYERIIDLSNIARKEGLLALEEEVSSFKMKKENESLLFMLMMLVVDGTDPEYVYEAGINRHIAFNFKSYDGLISLMSIRGTLLIQEGLNPRVIEEMLRTLVPPEILKTLEAKECQNALPEALKEVEAKIELIKSYSNENDLIDEHDHTIVGQLSIAFVNMCDRDICRLLRDTDNSDLSMAMKGMKGQARKRIFDNLSERLSYMIAENMEFMGPVRMRDVEKSAAKILKEYVSLVECCELRDANVAAIKLVIDMYENAEKSNREMKDKYSELKYLIDRIYNS